MTQKNLRGSVSTYTTLYSYLEKIYLTNFFKAKASPNFFTYISLNSI